MKRLALRVLLAAGLGAGAVLPAAGQEISALRSQILTIDQEQLFLQSSYGKSVLRAFEDQSNQLAQENRAIEAELINEEQSLTNLRPTLDPAQFREKALAFDEKVVAIRAQQDVKARDLIRRREEAQSSFLTVVLPVLSEIARERGAVAVLESRTVVMSAGQIDITQEAISRIDSQLSQQDAPNTPMEPQGDQ